MTKSVKLRPVAVAGRILRLLSLVFPVVVVLSDCRGQNAVSTKAAQVRIVDVIWGFDGRVSAGYFQPLSLLLDNLSGDVIEGTVSIRLTTGFSRHGSGAMQQPLYLGGQSRRWVQFYPYVPEVTDSWTVELQTENGKFELQALDPPRLAVDAAWGRIQQSSGQAGSSGVQQQTLPAVFLDPPRKQDRQPVTVRHMPAEIFPPYATATGGLYAVFLDHVPDWEEPRQQAFLAWLRRGGQLHLLLDDNRRELVFPGPLSVLNEPVPEFSIDAGTVYREDIQRQELEQERVDAVVREPLKADADEDLLIQSPANAAAAGMGSLSGANLLNDDDLFALMRGIVEPKHAWALIALLSFAYVIALYPGIWKLSSATRFSPLKTISAVLGLSAVFSVVFLWLGRRGYGESESLQTLLVASAEDQRHWNCLQFTQLFATDGGMYQLSDQNHQALLSCGTRLDRSDSLIQPGNSATMTARLAPYSTETLTMARRLELPDWRVFVNRQQLQGSSLATLELSLGPEFPFAEDTLCLAIVGKTAWELTLNEQQGKATLKGTAGIQLSNLLWREYEVAPTWWAPTTAPVADLEAGNDADRQRRKLLIRRALAQRSLVPGKLQIGPGAVLLVVEAALPEEFRLKLEPAVPETGRVLYVKTLRLDGVAGQ
ncbi:MAG: hypothetical protein ACKO2P_02260 [Planctomycetota bacterium]